MFFQTKEHDFKIPTGTGVTEWVIVAVILLGTYGERIMPLTDKNTNSYRVIIGEFSTHNVEELMNFREMLLSLQATFRTSLRSHYY